MSYVVLARKLRPVKFEDLIGQETIWKTLLNAIAKDRVAHAFLFTGPRGIGKTSCARILTKALNCLNPQNHEPCNECENCREINDNVSTDVLEIDAASNRGIEHIRELRDNVKYSPAKSRYKTYIIDEAHMLTIESFNALLKTLEEPPAHVKFILATTDPHKIPQTVISRCQRYDFVRIRMATMVDYLKQVAVNEGIIVSEPALTLVARRAAGGMRDALTSLDMLISYAGMNIPEEDVAAILGISDPAETENLFNAILNKDATRAVSLFQQALERGQSISILLNELMELVKDVTLIKTIPPENNYWRDFLPSQMDHLDSMAQNCSESQLQQYFGILLEMEAQIKRSTQAKICMEMGLMKLCRVESLIGVAEILKQLKTAGSSKKKTPESIKQSPPDYQKKAPVKSPATSATGNKQIQQEPVPPTAPTEQASPQPKETQPSPPIVSAVKLEPSAENWEPFVGELSKDQDVPPRFVSMLRNAVLVELTAEKLVLSSNGQSRLENLSDKDRALLLQLLQSRFSSPVQAEILAEKTSNGLTLKEKEDLQNQKEMEDKKKAAEKDPLVQSFLKEFSGSKIIKISLEK